MRWNPNNFRVAHKMMVLVTFFVATLVTYGAVSYNIMSTVQVNGPIYADVVRNKDLSQLDHVTQQNAGSSEEIASSAADLTSQVVGLTTLVGQFKVGDSATENHTTPLGRTRARAHARRSLDRP